MGVTMSSDPTSIRTGISAAEDAFEYSGESELEYEEGIDQDEDWKKQLTKACRYLEACRTLRDQDGFSGAVVELSFGAIERSLEAFMISNTRDELRDFQNHERVYDRAAERGLFELTTANSLKELYSSNRTSHYYGALVPTNQKEVTMFNLAEDIHDYVCDQIQEGGVCIC